MMSLINLMLACKNDIFVNFIRIYLIYIEFYLISTSSVKSLKQSSSLAMIWLKNSCCGRALVKLISKLFLQACIEIDEWILVRISSGGVKFISFQVTFTS